MLDLSKGGRIRRGGKIWPETVHCRNYITTQFQIYFEYKVFAVTIIFISKIQIVFHRNSVERIHLKHITTTL